MAKATKRAEEPAQRHLVKFSIKNLFGHLDHAVPLNQSERITIVHARNGYGKTVILKLIAALFSESPSTKSLDAFSRYEFERISFELSDGRTLFVTQEEPKAIQAERTGGRHRRVKFELRRSSKRERGPWSPRRAINSSLGFPLSYVEHRIPELSRVGVQRWLRRSDGVVLDLEDIVEIYGGRMHFLQRLPQIDQPKWLVELRQSISCTLIETQRLTSERPAERRGSEVQIVARVQEFANDLAAKMAAEVKRYATLSQSLDQTFPQRFLMRRDVERLAEKQLSMALEKLQISRKRLMEAGLLQQAEDDTMRSTGSPH